MHYYHGVVKLFNGRYWKHVDVKTKATDMPVAVTRATRTAIKQYRSMSRKRLRVLSVIVELERGAKVVTVKEKETDNAATDETIETPQLS